MEDYMTLVSELIKHPY